MSCVVDILLQPSLPLLGVYAAAQCRIRSCIRTGCPAVKVEYGVPGRVVVTCGDGREEEGTHVVSTLPLSVMQDGVSTGFSVTQGRLKGLTSALVLLFFISGWNCCLHIFSCPVFTTKHFFCCWRTLKCILDCLGKTCNRNVCVR